MRTSKYGEDWSIGFFRQADFECKAGKSGASTTLVVQAFASGASRAAPVNGSTPAQSICQEPLNRPWNRGKIKSSQD